MTMNIFLTGATGFIGGSILRSVLSENNTIYAVSRRKDNRPMRNVKWVICEDLFDLACIEEYMKDIDVVIHAAAFAHQTRKTGAKDYNKFLSINVELTKKVYASACKFNVKHFLFLSSIGAIASQSKVLISETTMPQPDNDYGRSKHLAEIELMEMRKSHETPITIVRPCLVYGEGNPGNMKRLSDLLGLKVPLPFGLVTEKRSFLYIENLIDFLDRALLNEKAFDDDFNVADKEFSTLTEIVREIAKAKNIDVRIFRFPIIGLKVLGVFGDLASILRLRVGFDSYSVNRLIGGLSISIKKSEEKLNWTPPYRFRDAIQMTFGNHKTKSVT